MSDVTDGIRDYLASGGLFNPELMDHQRVRDLLIESRDEIERLRQLFIMTAAKHEGELIKRDDEIERLRLENSQWQSACAGYTEALAARDKENKELRYRLEKLEK